MAVSPTDDAEVDGTVLDRLPSLPAPVRTAAVGLLAGVAGGATATAVDPGSTLATVALVLVVVGAVTAAWLRWRSRDVQ